ncbi:MAG: hypothetical protein Fur0010_23140 [Bdellovibrio sp.]
MIAIFILGTIVSCQESHQSYQPKYSKVGHKKEYILGVHPLHNPQRLHEVFSPILNIVNKQLDNEVLILEASRSYADYDLKMKEQHFDFSLPNPYQTLLSIDQGYTVFAKMSDDFNFKGIIVARKDAHLKSPKDLMGQ